MMRNLASILILGAALASAAPAAAQHRAASKAHAQHRDNDAAVLNARIASLDMQISMLRDRGVITSEEAQNLRDQSRGIHRRLNGMSTRDVRDVEFGLDRLETRVRYAVDDTRWGGDAFQDDPYRLADPDRYARNHRSYHHDVDRYTGTPEDRWHDPFDHGDDF